MSAYVQKKRRKKRKPPARERVGGETLGKDSRMELGSTAGHHRRIALCVSLSVPLSLCMCEMGEEVDEWPMIGKMPMAAVAVIFNHSHHD